MALTESFTEQDPSQNLTQCLWDTTPKCPHSQTSRRKDVNGDHNGVSDTSTTRRSPPQHNPPSIRTTTTTTTTTTNRRNGWSYRLAPTAGTSHSHPGYTSASRGSSVSSPSDTPPCARSGRSPDPDTTKPGTRLETTSPTAPPTRISWYVFFFSSMFVYRTLSVNLRVGGGVSVRSRAHIDRGVLDDGRARPGHAPVLGRPALHLRSLGLRHGLDRNRLWLVPPPRIE